MLQVPNNIFLNLISYLIENKSCTVTMTHLSNYGQCIIGLDISWLVGQVLRQERSGHHSFGGEQKYILFCDSQCQNLTRRYTTTTIIGLSVNRN